MIILIERNPGTPDSTTVRFEAEFELEEFDLKQAVAASLPDLGPLKVIDHLVASGYLRESAEFVESSHRVEWRLYRS